MKLFKISQNVNTGYDTYDSAIVCAKNEAEAKAMHPNGNLTYDDYEEGKTQYGTWCKKEFVNVKYIGEAKEGLAKGIICASFNAG